MRIQLKYEQPSRVKTDLLVVILDPEVRFHDLGESPLDEIVRRVIRDVKEKRLKTDYFTSLDSRGVAGNLAVYSTALNPGYNTWENVKTFVARAIRSAHDHGLRDVSLLMNTEGALPYVGKAVEGALLGSYSFDRYKREKAEFDKIDFNIVALKKNDQENRRHVSRYTLVSQAVNQARDIINEPGSVVTPEYLAQTARDIAKKSDLD